METLRFPYRICANWDFKHLPKASQVCWIALIVPTRLCAMRASSHWVLQTSSQNLPDLYLCERSKLHSTESHVRSHRQQFWPTMAQFLSTDLRARIDRQLCRSHCWHNPKHKMQFTSTRRTTSDAAWIVPGSCDCVETKSLLQFLVFQDGLSNHAQHSLRSLLSRVHIRDGTNAHLYSITYMHALESQRFPEKSLNLYWSSYSAELNRLERVGRWSFRFG